MSKTLTPEEQNEQAKALHLRPERRPRRAVVSAVVLNTRIRVITESSRTGLLRDLDVRLGDSEETGRRIAREADEAGRKP